jgi:3-methyladenine DNA glycosylase AlkC
MDEDKAFKNWINQKVVRKMAMTFSEVYPLFNQKKFIKNASKLENLELKSRVRLLTLALKEELPGPFKKDAIILKRVIALKKLKSFELWPISEFISNYGLDEFEESFDLMFELTKDFTSEFAIRPFLKQDHERCLKILNKWLQDPSHHVRRWISEGTRPNLPWGGKITAFIEKPQTLELLDALKWDDAIYVRKSVANHLNDITKTHPHLVLKILKRWEQESVGENLNKILWIKRHALRTLIKKGDPKALSLMGVSQTLSLKVHHFRLLEKKLVLGDHLIFELELELFEKKGHKIIIDYGIRFRKANGTSGLKIFKLKTIHLKPRSPLKMTKKHSLRKISTMKFYPGEHSILIQINGIIYKEVSWNLKI